MFNRAQVALSAMAITALLAACSDSATSPATDAPKSGLPSATLIPPSAADIVESYTLGGNAVAGGTVNLRFNLTNVGTGDYVPLFKVFGETRPRAAFGEVVLPPGFKRQVPAANLATDNPLILCEAYRGTHGGLSQSLFSDVCRLWFYGPIAAGATVTAVIPVKLVGGEGDFTTWGGAEVYPVDEWGAGAMVPLNNNQWISQVVHVNPAPPKTGTVGSLPDLQAGGKASTGSPAQGSEFYLLMTAKNSGKIDGTNPSFTTTVPAGLTITFASFDYGSCAVSGQTISCTSDHPVFPGMTFTAAIYLTAPTAPGTFTTTGTWAVSNGETNLTNNTSSVSVAIR